MHGSEAASPLSVEVGPVLDGFENTIDDTNEDNCNPPETGGHLVESMTTLLAPQDLPLSTLVLGEGSLCRRRTLHLTRLC